MRQCCLFQVFVEGLQALLAAYSLLPQQPSVATGQGQLALNPGTMAQFRTIQRRLSVCGHHHGVVAPNTGKDSREHR